MDPRVTELHYITPMKNVPSILTHGILSHSQASSLPHTSVANPIVQQRRAHVVVPNGMALHSYVNLYFNARNPMMYTSLDKVNDICILHVSCDVLRLRGVVLSDANASSKYARFLSLNQWRNIVFDDVFALSWDHADQRRKWQHKSRMCAEVLVPHRVGPEHINGAHVVNVACKVRLNGLAPKLQVGVTPHLFFR